MTVVLAFFIICSGIFILQMSKVDPRELVNVDERTSLLLQAARAEVDPKAARELERDISLASRLSRRRTGTSMHTYPHTYPGSRIVPVNGADLESMVPVPSNRPGDDGTTDAQVLLEEENIDPDEEVKAIVEKSEDPGIDALRGTFGAIGTVIRARKRKTVLAQVLQQQRSRTASHASRSSASASVPMSFISNTRSYIRPSQSRTKEKESGFVADPEKQAMRSYSLMSETSSVQQQQQRQPLTASPELNASPRLPALPSVQFSDMESNGGGRSAPVTSNINNNKTKEEDPLDRAGAALSPKRAQTLPTIFKRGIPISFLDEKKDH